MTKREIQGLAHAGGFDAVAIAPAIPAPHSEAFHAWLGEGCHASMDWLARNPGLRCSPEELLPGAKSLLMLAMNYFQPDPPATSDLQGKIARYARGRDYHNFLPKHLRQIDRALSARGGTQRCFVDSGPLLERDFAALAGLGWQGKSSMLIHPKLGTWFLLAGVLTTLELEPDAPARDHCGTCTRCISACPTGAIVAPRKVDARKCLSYWTIEHRGPLPEEIRPLIGDRIFGCDDCLDACPWNRFAQASREASFAERPASRFPLRDYLALDDSQFRALFEGSPIRRAKRQGFLRNVCIALGNIGASRSIGDSLKKSLISGSTGVPPVNDPSTAQLTPADLQALESASHDTDPVVADAAQWALNRVRR